ncbi:accessory regulator protein B [Clostridium homopropionicum DSM 5847]|uniref:Putative AgrB-like protein n=1 Tax=Clostridium homopropionicum DSM 5847 TaxID=1121318 RepID=A0A0L6ZBD9_9CLOT|nr:accessory gene regulator AgrB [Clostridium homopropionicum]KOA20281.1 accessory regulator protein B [Clostridium homopropionicum DSM 5847]SFG79995.1 accessory gene regulator B [Clostridium homopropionicum]
MNIINRFYNSFFSYIKINLGKSEEDIEKIRYGLQVIFMNIFKMIILFVTAYFLGLFKYTLISLLSFGFIRTFSCGVHADSSIKCITCNFIIFLGNVLLSLSFSLNFISMVILFSISLILIIKYAPADTAERPLVSKKLRRTLKIKSCIAVLLLFLLSILLTNPIYKNILVYSALQESFLITPLAYSILKKPYRNYENIEI